VPLDVWDSNSGCRKRTPVMLKYLRPMLDGMSYYDRFGYYTINREEWPIDATQHSRVAPDRSTSVKLPNASQLKSAQSQATAHLNRLNAIRTAQIRGGALAQALAAIEHDASERTPPSHQTRIYRFALALAAAQEEALAGRDLVAAFRAAAEGQQQAHCEGDLPHQYGVHARSAVPYDRRLTEFIERHEAALTAEVLSAPHLGEMAQRLYRRNRGCQGERAGLDAGGLLLAIVFDFFAVFAPRRFMPLKRKDFEEDGLRMSALAQEAGAASATTSFSIRKARRVPILSEAFFLCAAAGSADECRLPWDVEVA